MKKTLAVFMLALGLGQRALACDICGGANHLNPYLFPHLSRSYVSFAYLRSLYFSTEDGSQARISSNSLLISGQYTVSSRLRLMAFLPYHFNRSEVGESVTNTRGLGDVSLLASFNVLSFGSGHCATGACATGSWQHVFNVGAGVKLPTGRYNADKTSELNNENLQLGSGSLDYLANVNYRVSKGDLSLSAVAAYKYTTPNSSGYRYGDVLTTGATLVYAVRGSKFSLTPYLQAMQENHYRDAEHHILQNHSGGQVLYTGGGVDASTDRLTVGLNYQVAASQNLMQGELIAKPKFSARISVTL